MQITNTIPSPGLDDPAKNYWLMVQRLRLNLAIGMDERLSQSGYAQSKLCCCILSQHHPT